MPPYHHTPPQPGEPLRVLMLSSNFPKPELPRMGVWAMSMAQALRRQGVELTVVSFTSWVPRVIGKLGVLRAWANCPREHTWDGLRTIYPRYLLYQKGAMWRHMQRHPAPHASAAWASGKRALLRVVDEVRPHAVYCNYTLPQGELARRLRELRGIPYILNDHSLDEIADCEHHPARRAAFGRVLAAASTWVGVSSPMLRDMERLFPGTRATVIPNGADPVPDELLHTPRPKELDGKTVIFSAGGFFPVKGFPDLVHAFAKAAPRHPDAVLRIAGEGETMPEVRAAIDQTGMQGRVQLLGPLLHRRVLQEMVWCDLFALLSRAESFGVVYMEAASAGKPLIWTSGAGASDVLRDGEHGRLVPPRDPDAAARAMDELLGNAETRREMGAAARELLFSHLTWDAAARRMTDLLRSATENPR